MLEDSVGDLVAGQAERLERSESLQVNEVIIIHSIVRLLVRSRPRSLPSCPEAFAGSAWKHGVLCRGVSLVRVQIVE